MIKKYFSSIVLIIVGLFLVWYLYQEYKKTYRETAIEVISAQESL